MPSLLPGRKLKFEGLFVVIAVGFIVTVVFDVCCPREHVDNTATGWYSLRGGKVLQLNLPHAPHRETLYSSVSGSHVVGDKSNTFFLFIMAYFGEILEINLLIFHPNG